MSSVFRRRRVSRQTLLDFTRQLRVFIRSGIALDIAIRIIADESDDDLLRTALGSVLEDLNRGDSLSEGFARHPNLFPDYFVGLMRSAEATGAFVETLESLIDYQSRTLQTRAKISSALAYPAIVMALALVTVAILTGFVLPRFQPLFEELGSTVPLPTRILLNTSSLITGNLIWISVAFIGLGSIVWAILRSSRGRRSIDALVLRLPLIGTIITYVMLERFCRIFAAAVRSGLPVASGMRLSTQTISNSLHRDLLARATQDMVMGIEFSVALSRTNLLPGAVRQMFRVGEETGALEEQIVAAGEYFDSQLEQKMQRFTSLFEPFLIVFVGLMVGFVAVALVSAMYGVLDGVRDIT